LLRVDLKTNRVIGIGVKDMESLNVNYVLRKKVRRLPVPSEGLTLEASATYGYWRAMRESSKGYEYFKDAVLKHIFRYFLSAGDLRRLVAESNQFIVNQFNASYANRIGQTE